MNCPACGRPIDGGPVVVVYPDDIAAALYGTASTVHADCFAGPRSGDARDPGARTVTCTPQRPARARGRQVMSETTEVSMVDGVRRVAIERRSEHGACDSRDAPGLDVRVTPLNAAHQPREWRKRDEDQKGPDNGRPRG
jgi:hypothetical protein